MNTEPWSMPMSLAVFLGGTAVIGVAGTKLSALADRLADRTGLGEAFMGAVFLGASTSLPGITASVTAASAGLPALAMSNALGGIAAQTVFLAIADFFYRKANLEHAAASVPNMMMGALLIVLLAFILVGMVGPPFAFWGVHPITPILFLGYLFGMHMIYGAREKPMWRPRMTRATRVDRPEEAPAPEPPILVQWLFLSASAVLVIGAGWWVTRAAGHMVAAARISESVAGGVFVAVATSLPELVTSVAAVRRGALTLAVGGVLGGNAFDTLFAAAADVAYREGSIYQSVSLRERSLVTLTIMMTGVLLLGLLRRQHRGIINIGFESFLMLILYVVGVVMLAAV